MSVSMRNSKVQPNSDLNLTEKKKGGVCPNGANNDAFVLWLSAYKELSIKSFKIAH